MAKIQRKSGGAAPKTRDSSRSATATAHCRLRLLAALAVVGFGFLLVPVTPAIAAGSAAFSLRNVAQPTHFSPNDEERCDETSGLKCDSYQLLATNIGDAATAGNLTLVDKLPLGARPLSIVSGKNSGSELELQWTCTEAEAPANQWTVSCEFKEPVQAGGYVPFIDLRVTAPAVSSGTQVNVATIEGGGAGSVTAIEETAIDSTPPLFGISDFSVLPTAADGSVSSQAGGHPWNYTITFKTPSIFAAGLGSGNAYQPLTNLKSIAAELPVGFIGNRQAVGTCTPRKLQNEQCPAASRVGTFALLAGGISDGEFGYTGGSTAEPPSALYSMVPEHGYPTEFGFNYANVSVLLYASLVRDGPGYHFRIVAPGIPSVLEASYLALTLFGDPGALNEGGSEPAFLTNPADCTAGSLAAAAVELERWEVPGQPVSASTAAYPTLSGCSGLEFKPLLRARPTTNAADSPAAAPASAPAARTSATPKRPNSAPIMPAVTPAPTTMAITTSSPATARSLPPWARWKRSRPCSNSPFPAISTSQPPTARPAASGMPRKASCSGSMSN
jgi:hypothetical protein